MFKGRLLRFVGVAAVTVMVIVVIILGATGLPVTKAAPLTVQSTCVPANVAIYVGNRIHVKCTTPINGIGYFGLPASSPDAASVVALLSAAYIAQKPVYVSYDPNDVSGASFGCQANDCRTIQLVWMGQ
jgi:hypothetical protein